jgi:hypothetical protein
VLYSTTGECSKFTLFSSLDRKKIYVLYAKHDVVLLRLIKQFPGSIIMETKWPLTLSAAKKVGCEA